MGIKVVLLTEIISPYRIPVFNKIAQILNAKFLVFFFGESEKRRQWRIYREKIKFCYEVLPRFLFQNRNSSPYFFNPTIFYKLMKYSPDIIITGGYHHPSFLLAMLYAKLFKRRIILWSESNRYDQRSNHPAREIYKRWFVRNCTGYIVPGKASFEYLLSLGAEAKKIWIAPNAVDNDYFTWAGDKYREIKELFRQSKGYPKRNILYVGHLIEEKGILDLLRAFQNLLAEYSDLGLLLVGNGKQAGQYREFCKINHIKNVFFVGFVHQEDLPVYYAMADVFVSPTHSDTWGLVLNEAMACKLPVISSDVAGAAGDLILNGENGYIFKKGDIQGLSNYLKEILSDEQKRNRMGQRSFEIIQDYSPFKSAQGFIQAIRQI